MRKVTRKYTFEKNQFPFNSYRRHSHNQTITTLLSTQFLSYHHAVSGAPGFQLGGQPKHFRKSHMTTFTFISSNSCCTCGKYVYRWENKSLVIVHCAFVWNSLSCLKMQIKTWLNNRMINNMDYINIFLPIYEL